jgi:hypothetical protein
MRVGSSAQQEQRGGARGPGAEGGAKNSARGYDGAQQIGFKKFGNKIRDGHGAPADQLHHFFFSEAADFAAEFQKLPEIFVRRLFDDRRSEVEQLACDGAGASDFLGEFEIFCAVFLGEVINLAGGGRGIGVQHEGAAIEGGREHAHGRFEFFQAVARELHVLDNGGEQRAAGVRYGGTFEAGMKFLGDGGAADDRPAFEDEGLVAFLREIEGGDESVVSAAENDDVALRGHAQLLPVSFRISSAARRPGAPMMPPPGCVAEPHMYNFLMGVR